MFCSGGDTGVNGISAKIDTNSVYYKPKWWYVNKIQGLWWNIFLTSWCWHYYPCLVPILLAIAWPHYSKHFKCLLLQCLALCTSTVTLMLTQDRLNADLDQFILGKKKSFLINLYSNYIFPPIFSIYMYFFPHLPTLNKVFRCFKPSSCA